MRTDAIDTRVLEASIAAASIAIDPEGASLYQRPETAYSMYANELVVRLQRFVYREKVGTEVVAVYPRDWFEHLKERFAPAWVKARWPVQFTRCMADFFASFPAYVPPSGLGPMVRVMEFKGPFNAYR